MIYPKPIATLIEHLRKFPSVGPKSAQRMAFQILKMSNEEVKSLAEAIVNAKAQTCTCEICFNVSNTSPCEICSSSSRDRSTICVVAETRDLIAIEKTNEYKGLFHVLQGLISPMDGIGADDIRIKELLSRVNKGDTNEVIIATNPDVEGEATAMYISKLLKPLDIKVSRIAQGISMGSELEYADEVTLSRALSDRKEM